jgi:hypothetical protein
MVVGALVVAAAGALLLAAPSLVPALRHPQMSSTVWIHYPLAVLLFALAVYGLWAARRSFPD